MKGNKAQTFLVLSICLCIVLGFVAWMYLYTPQVEKTQQLVSENKTLEVRVNELIAFSEVMPQNQKDIEEMTADIRQKLADFPADCKEEDALALALKSWENKILVAYTQLAIGEREYLATIPQETVAGAKIEGLEEELSFVSRMVTYNSKTLYEDLKELVTCFNENQEEMAITELSYKADTQTGILEGYITTTFFTAQGTGKEYTPRVFTDYQKGLMNLFDVSKFGEKLSVIPEELSGAVDGGR